uniref:DUF834 domain-containing protein n=1 Tax=Oryza glumipatula TaxID=40148 RepID=A0A0E0A721_9ORYZ
MLQPKAGDLPPHPTPERAQAGTAADSGGDGWRGGRCGRQAVGDGTGVVAARRAAGSTAVGGWEGALPSARGEAAASLLVGS